MPQEMDGKRAYLCCRRDTRSIVRTCAWIVDMILLPCFVFLQVFDFLCECTSMQYATELLAEGSMLNQYYEADCFGSKVATADLNDAISNLNQYLIFSVIEILATIVSSAIDAVEGSFLRQACPCAACNDDETERHIHPAPHPPTPPVASVATHHFPNSLPTARRA